MLKEREAVDQQHRREKGGLEGAEKAFL